MTYTPLDDSTVGADYSLSAFHTTRLIENAEDNETNRSPACTRLWSEESNRVEWFSSPTDDWRTIPVAIPACRHAKQVRVKVRYESEGTGITAGSQTGDLKFVAGGAESTVTTVNATSGVTEATLTVDSGGAGGAGAGWGELAFRSVRGSTLGSFEVFGLPRPNLLQISDPGGVGPSIGAAGGEHLEIELTGLTDVLRTTYHIPRAFDADASADWDVNAYIYPHVRGPAIFPPSDGTEKLSCDLYNLGKLKVYSIQVEVVGGPTRSITRIPEARTVGGGLPSAARRITAISRVEITQYRDLGSRCYAVGPTASLDGGSANTYVYGVRAEAATSWVRVGGALIQHREDAGVVRAWMRWCPLSDPTGLPGDGVLRMRLTLTQVSGGSASGSSTVDTSYSGRPTLFAGRDPGNLYSYNARKPNRSEWGVLDTGRIGDVLRLPLAFTQEEVPSGVSAGDYYVADVEVQDLDVWVGGLCIRDVIDVV